MKSSFTQLTIDELILHEVPRARRRDDEAEPVQLSDIPVVLTKVHRDYLQERFRGDLQGSARDVKELEDHTSPLPSLIKDLLTSKSADLVPASQTMATHLRGVQTGSNNAGLLMVARCTWAGDAALLIAKVELEQGVQARQTVVNGKTTYDMTVLRDLVFGETSQIYKAGIFDSADVRGAESELHGLVVDRQKTGPSVTRFFRVDYLGCDYIADAGELTRRFFEATRQFINKNVTDPEDKARYMLALTAEIDSNRREINPQAFANDHLGSDDAAGLLNALGAAGSPMLRFTKSAEYVATQIVRYETQQHVVVLAHREQVDQDIVEVGEDFITVHDRVSQLGTQGSPGRKPSAKPNS